MTDRQRATVALLAYIIKTRRYSKDFNVWVYRYDQPYRYRHRFERQFTPDYLSLRVLDNYLEVTHDKIFIDQHSTHLYFFYKASQLFRMELRVEDDKDYFEGLTPNRNRFYGRFLISKTIDFIEIDDPETDTKNYRYVVEFI